MPQIVEAVRGLELRGFQRTSIATHEGTPPGEAIGSSGPASSRSIAALKPSDVGKQLVKLMRLDSIPERDKAARPREARTTRRLAVKHPPEPPPTGFFYAKRPRSDVRIFLGRPESGRDLGTMSPHVSSRKRGRSTPVCVGGSWADRPEAERSAHPACPDHNTSQPQPQSQIQLFLDAPTPFQHPTAFSIGETGSNRRTCQRWRGLRSCRSPENPLCPLVLASVDPPKRRDILAPAPAHLVDRRCRGRMTVKLHDQDAAVFVT